MGILAVPPAIRTERFWDGLARQLAHPEGWRGRLLGRLMSVGNRAAVAAAIDALAPRHGADILDLGCGPGDAVLRLLRDTLTGRVTGVDLSPAMVAQARARCRAAGFADRTRLIEGQFDHLPLADASMDGVLAVNVAYFWHDPAPILAELRRVLRPDGRLVVYVTQAEAMRDWKIMHAGLHRLWTATELEALLRSSRIGNGKVAVHPTRVFGVDGLIGVVG